MEVRVLYYRRISLLLFVFGNLETTACVGTCLYLADDVHITSAYLKCHQLSVFLFYDTSSTMGRYAVNKIS